MHGHLLVLRDGRIVTFRWFQTVEEAHAAAHERNFRSGMEAYSRGDYAAALSNFHPLIEWSAETDLVPDAEVYVGHAGARRSSATWAEAIEGMTIEVEECRAVGDDSVLAITRAGGRRRRLWTVPAVHGDLRLGDDVR